MSTVAITGNSGDFTVGDCVEINKVEHELVRAWDENISFFDKAARDMEKLSREWAQMCESVYKKHHGKIPGSKRTKRLRKKRETAVVNWFKLYMDEANRKILNG